NDIGIELLKHLNDKELRELLPNSLGMRKLISLRIRELQQQDDCNASDSTIRETESPASTITIYSDDPSGIEGATTPNIHNTTATEVSQDIQFEFIDFNVANIITPQLSFPDFDLRTLLQTTPMGSSILKYYQQHNILDHTRRTRLVDIIIKHMYSYIIKNRMKHEEYNQVAAKIISLFPRECLGTYYVPPIRKSESIIGKSVLARGKLVDKVRNLIHKCEEANPKRKRRSKESNDSTDEILEKRGRVNNDDMTWLKVNSEPWAEVMEKWNNTYDLRRCDKDCPTVQEYLERWPILRDLRSDVLINQDFRKLFPEKELKLYTKWESFFEVVANLKLNCLKDSVALQLHESVPQTENEDAKFLKQLTLLPYFLPPKGRIITQKAINKHWKFSTLETLHAIVVTAKVAGDIEPVISQQVHNAQARGQRVQPYLLVEGTAEDPKRFYVVIDGRVHLSCESAKRSFDLLFKIFHVINANYPIQAEYIYTLLQKCVYEINLPSDKIPPYVSDILSNFK
ncbi:hypothetical protein PPYR_02299, partial [Photinus pyralis]